MSEYRKCDTCGNIIDYTLYCCKRCSGDYEKMSTEDVISEYEYLKMMLEHNNDLNPTT